MKRILCLVLCLVMLLPMALTGCSGGLKLGDSTDAKATTITITTIKNDGVTDEAVQLVQAALNEITENLYNTHVVLNMLPADEYQAYVVAQSEKNYLNGAGAVDTGDDEEDATSGEKEEEEEEAEIFVDKDGNRYTYAANGDKLVYDEYDRTSVVYPEATEGQLDIILIDSIETYNKLLSGYEIGEGENEPYLVDLAAELMPAYGGLLKKYVSSSGNSALAAASQTGKTYAIPNNTYYDEYRYMVINKELFDKYQYDANTVSSFSDITSFLFDLVENKEDVTPLYSYAGYSWLSYLDFDSVFGKQRENSYTYDAVLRLSTVFGIADYRRTMNSVRELKLAGCSWQENEHFDLSEVTEEFGVAMVKGDPSIPSQYGDEYYVVTIEKPQLDNDVYNSMYAISSGCSYPERAMEILTLLSTNETVVNLLAYGIEGTHYELDKNDVVVNRSADYGMPIRYAGNMFLLKTSEDMDETMLKYAENNWALAKEQNKSMTISPYCGFAVTVDDEMQSLLDEFKQVSDSFIEQFENYDQYLAEGGTLDYMSYMLYLRDEFEKTDVYKKITEVNLSEPVNTPFQQYNTFFAEHYRAST